MEYQYKVKDINNLESLKRIKKKLMRYYRKIVIIRKSLFLVEFFSITRLGKIIQKNLLLTKEV